MYCCSAVKAENIYFGLMSYRYKKKVTVHCFNPVFYSFKWSLLFLHSTCFPHHICMQPYCSYIHFDFIIYLRKMIMLPFDVCHFIWLDDTIQHCREAPLALPPGKGSISTLHAGVLSLRSVLVFSTLFIAENCYYAGLKGQLSFNWQFNVLACQQSFAPEAPHHAIQLQLISATILIIRRLLRLSQ